mmetsp:Transcript_22216/g.32265  ORF Transcript_22216/g.32265 Transcript_22216/m.32265 type:complete len:234 (+) Transcript_22216:148-849(+)
MAEPVVVSVSETEKTDFIESLWSCKSAKNCAYACFCGQCAIASVRSKFDDSSCLFNFFLLNPCATRNIIREGYRLKGGCIDDILLSTCCCCCSIAQLLNEVDSRGQVTTEYGTNRPATQQTWRVGLCSCCESTNNCIYGCLCPCIALAQARTNFDGGDMVFTLLCFPPCLTRSVIREGYHIGGHCCGDVCVSSFCLPCSVCQMLNEVDSRGRVTKQHIQVSAAAPLATQQITR